MFCYSDTNRGNISTELLFKNYVLTVSVYWVMFLFQSCSTLLSISQNKVVMSNFNNHYIKFQNNPGKSIGLKFILSKSKLFRAIPSHSEPIQKRFLSRLCLIAYTL